VRLDDLLPPGVADAFGLGSTPQAPEPLPPAGGSPRAAVALNPEPKPAKPRKPRKKKTQARKRRPTRSEELDVVARETGRHRDLRGTVGFLTLDYDCEGRPYEATYDPFDERKKNAIMPVLGILQSGTRVHVTDDEGVRWRFDVLGTPAEYDEQP